MFPIEPGKDYAVITGDVIGSSNLEAGPRKQLPELIHRVSDELLAWRGEETLTPLSIFGGDSWRVLLADPRDALRVGLYVRSSLLASKLDIDTRLVIGVAGVDFVTEGGSKKPTAKPSASAVAASPRGWGAVPSFSLITTCRPLTVGTWFAT